VLVKSPSRAGASIGKSRSFLGSIFNSPSRGESLQPCTSLNQEPSGLGLVDDIVLVKSPSRAGGSISKSRSFLGSIFNSPSRGESLQPCTSLNQEPSGQGLDESPGIAIQASPSQIANGEEVKDAANHQEGNAMSIGIQASPSQIANGEEVKDATNHQEGNAMSIGIQASPSQIANGEEVKDAANHQEGNAMSIGIQASPSKIARGDDPTAVSDHGVGFEVEIKPTSCLLTPHSDGDKKKEDVMSPTSTINDTAAPRLLTPHSDGDKKNEDLMSHTSTITDTAAGESIPLRIDVQTKGKGTKNLSRLEYYRQLGAAKATSKPKKPGRNIFGLRRKGDPYYSDRAAAKKANKAFIGLRPSSKVKPYYGPENQGNLSKLRKSSGITKSNKHQGVSTRLPSYCIVDATRIFPKYIFVLFSCRK
jgi:hypothetical protein